MTSLPQDVVEFVYSFDAANQLETMESALRVLGEFSGEKPFPTLTAAGVVWLAGFRFEIKVVASLPRTS